MNKGKIKLLQALQNINLLPTVIVTDPISNATDILKFTSDGTSEGEDITNSWSGCLCGKDAILGSKPITSHVITLRSKKDIKLIIPATIIYKAEDGYHYHIYKLNEPVSLPEAETAGEIACRKHKSNKIHGVELFHPKLPLPPPLKQPIISFNKECLVFLDRSDVFANDPDEDFVYDLELVDKYYTLIKDPNIIHLETNFRDIEDSFYFHKFFSIIKSEIKYTDREDPNFIWNNILKEKWVSLIAKDAVHSNSFFLAWLEKVNHPCKDYLLQKFDKDFYKEVANELKYCNVYTANMKILRYLNDNHVYHSEGLFKLKDGGQETGCQSSELNITCRYVQPKIKKEYLIPKTKGIRNLDDLWWDWCGANVYSTVDPTRYPMFNEEFNYDKTNYMFQKPFLFTKKNPKILQLIEDESKIIVKNLETKGSVDEVYSKYEAYLGVNRWGKDDVNRFAFILGCTILKKHFPEMWFMLSKILLERQVLGQSLSLLAALFRTPNNLTGKCLVLAGASGRGKTVLAEVLNRLIPFDSTVVSTDDVKNKDFCPFTRYKFVVVQDANKIGYTVENSLKALITDSTVPYKDKFVPKQDIPNKSQYMMLTNNSDIQVDTPRRWVISQVTDTINPSDLKEFECDTLEEFFAKKLLVKLGKGMDGTADKKTYHLELFAHVLALVLPANILRDSLPETNQEVTAKSNPRTATESFIFKAIKSNGKNFVFDESEVSSSDINGLVAYSIKNFEGIISDINENNKNTLRRVHNPIHSVISEFSKVPGNKGTIESVLISNKNDLDQIKKTEFGVCCFRKREGSGFARFLVFDDKKSLAKIYLTRKGVKCNDHNLSLVFNKSFDEAEDPVEIKSEEDYGL